MKNYIRNNIRMRWWMKGDGYGDDPVWMMCFEICGQIPHSTFNTNIIIPIPSCVMCLNPLPNVLNHIHWNRLMWLWRLEQGWEWMGCGMGRFGEWGKCDLMNDCVCGKGGLGWLGLIVVCLCDWWIFHSFTCVLTNPHFVDMWVIIYQNGECVRY